MKVFIECPNEIKSKEYYLEGIELFINDLQKNEENHLEFMEMISHWTFDSYNNSGIKPFIKIHDAENNDKEEWAISLFYDFGCEEENDIINYILKYESVDELKPIYDMLYEDQEKIGYDDKGNSHHY